MEGGGFFPEEDPSSSSAAGGGGPRAPPRVSRSSGALRCPQQGRADSPPPLLPTPGPALPQGCSRCTSLSFSQQWAEVFGVVLCSQCQRGEPLISKVSLPALSSRLPARSSRRLPGPAGYQQVLSVVRHWEPAATAVPPWPPQSTAKQRYCVTDGDLKGLGFLRKPNPHRRDFQPMQLLLESQVRAAAHAKHGGQEGVEEHARALLDAKMEALAKVRAALLLQTGWKCPPRASRILRALSLARGSRYLGEHSLIAWRRGLGLGDVPGLNPCVTLPRPAAEAGGGRGRRRRGGAARAHQAAHHRRRH